MKKKLSLVIISMVILFALSTTIYAGAAGNVPNPFSTLSSVLQGAGQLIQDIFSLKWICSTGYGSGRVCSMNQLLAITRFVLWIICFALMYQAGQLVFNRGQAGNNGNRNAGIIAFCIATLTMVVLPDTYLIAFAEEYATILYLIITVVPPAAGLYFSYVLWPATTRWHHLVRFLILIVCWMILYGIDSSINSTFISAIPLLPVFFRGERK